MRIEQVGLFAWQPPGEKAGGQPGGQLLGGQEPSGQLHSGQGHQHSEQPSGHQVMWQQSTENSQSRKHEL